MNAAAVSAVMPVRDGARYLPETLPALLAGLPLGSELLVSDDGSKDGSGALAAALGARVVSSPESRGPAAARNRAVAVARGSIIVFVDADVRVAENTVAQLLEALVEPGVAAAFGSYDDEPPARSWVSLYKNLAHHYVHQQGSPEASTFWAGCGAVRRDALIAVGGFDEAFTRPSVEDVDLGYRLRAASHRVRLVRTAQAAHLKAWTLRSFLVSDFRDRAIPWTRLLRAGRALPHDLNFRTADRVAAVLTSVSALCLLLAPALPWLGLAAATCWASLALTVDRRFLTFLARKVSLPFAVVASLLHALHRLAACAGYATAVLLPTRPALTRPSSASASR